MNGTETANDKSLGGLVKDLTEDLSTLVRSEIALAKLEVKQAVVAMGMAGAMFVGAGFCALVAVAFLFVTAALGLVEIGVPAWLSTLIVAVVLLTICAILFFVGRKKMQGLNVIPTSTVENIKTDIAVIKTDLSRLRQRA